MARRAFVECIVLPFGFSDRTSSTERFILLSGVPHLFQRLIFCPPFVSKWLRTVQHALLSDMQIWGSK